MVYIRIEFNKRILTLPVNPEELNPESSADNEKVDVVGLGEIIIKNEFGLRSVSIESFFPSINSDFYTGVSPKNCIDFIERIKKSEKVARITTEGLPNNLNMYFVIDKFSPLSKAGEEEDIYYTLDITEYRPYGAKMINMQGQNIGVVENDNRVDTKPLVDPVYTTKEGDSLILITKRIVNDTSRWNELYNENKSVIGSNPNKLKVGVQLTLPESWVVY